MLSKRLMVCLSVRPIKNPPPLHARSNAASSERSSHAEDSRSEHDSHLFLLLRAALLALPGFGRRQVEEIMKGNPLGACVSLITGQTVNTRTAACDMGSP